MAIACVVRRARAAPVVSKRGTSAISARIVEMAAIMLIFRFCPVFPMAVRVVRSSEVSAMTIVVMDSMAKGMAPVV